MPTTPRPYFLWAAATLSEGRTIDLMEQGRMAAGRLREDKVLKQVAALILLMPRRIQLL
jgi:hypothetical protein